MLNVYYLRTAIVIILMILELKRSNFEGSVCDLSIKSYTTFPHKFGFDVIHPPIQKRLRSAPFFLMEFINQKLLRGVIFLRNKQLQPLQP
ncbi:hypothetical protein EGR_11139 [Echinococcus granulosus]|uniref:Secreted protein n=1 Tax=Echinococcus granulosus TaxID=6210 RepID=W6TYZ6_ECHGR|nr:hypothetical protein EGR_11139 [Echinococcus granulosus]EUB54005.1 hypothetical protein EGR_11139 [Echinococcus granulosus]